MRSILRAMLVMVALFAAFAMTGCSKAEDTETQTGTVSSGSKTGAPGVPKQGSANVGLEAPVAAPSGVQTGNYAGGRK